MSQQYVYGNANDKYRKKLFIDNGKEFVSVNAKIIEPYTPPTPQPNVKEIKIINAPSHIHNLGYSSYKVTLNLLFNDRQSFNDYLIYSDGLYKFYDERGNIFLGTLEAGIKYSAYEASERYKAEISLILIKKDWYETVRNVEFQDIEDLSKKDDILDLAKLGLISTRNFDGTPVLYFRPWDMTTRAEFTVVMNGLRHYLEKIIRK